MPDIPNTPHGWFRNRERIGIWHGRGKVAATGVGTAPTARRWDEKPETSMGALTIDAIRKAIADAGISPHDVDGIVMTPESTTGVTNDPNTPPPEGWTNVFKMVDYPQAGITRGDIDWTLLNMPELDNIKFKMYGRGCMSVALCTAAEAVAQGLTQNCIVVRGWHNLAGRYYVGQGAAALDTASGPQKYSSLWGTPAVSTAAFPFQEYLDKYGKSHDMMANFVVEQRRNGLMNPDGFYSQHRPEMITKEDYLSGRWIAKPGNLYDNDLPIMTAFATIFTTADRAKDHKAPPAYILNHAQTRPETNGVTPSLQSWELLSDKMGRMLYEGSGIGPDDLDFENMYDGFTLFHQFHLEGLRFRANGETRGYALDLYQEDISIEGPNPVSPSGGNSGNGRTRWWNHRDSILQVQGRSPSQIKNPANIGVYGAHMPHMCDSLIWSSSPSPEIKV
jgi:acetyl-CoA acetyltransferase